MRADLGGQDLLCSVLLDNKGIEIRDQLLRFHIEVDLGGCFVRLALFFVIMRGGDLGDEGGDHQFHLIAVFSLEICIELLLQLFLVRYLFVRILHDLLYSSRLRFYLI